MEREQPFRCNGMWELLIDTYSTCCPWTHSYFFTFPACTFSLCLPLLACLTYAPFPLSPPPPSLLCSTSPLPPSLLPLPSSHHFPPHPLIFAFISPAALPKDLPPFCHPFQGILRLTTCPVMHRILHCVFTHAADAQSHVWSDRLLHEVSKGGNVVRKTIGWAEWEE